VAEEQHIERKVLPHHDEAERVLLGAMMLDQSNIPRVMDILKMDSFYRRRHQLIFQAIGLLFDRAEEIDTVLVSDELAKRGEMQEVGGYDYLDSLVEGIPRTTNVIYYAGIVKEKAMLRNLAGFAQNLVQRAIEADTGAVELISAAESEMVDLRQGEVSHGFRELGGLLEESYAVIQERANNPSGLVGLKTGFIDYDRMTNGLQNGDLIIVAARPAMGKTSFCLNLALNAAIKANAKVAIYSLEMPAAQLAMRLIGSEARVGISSLRSGQLRDNEWERVAHAVGSLGEAVLYIDDSGDATVAKMRADLKRLDADVGIDLVVIDYLQLMTSSSLYQQQSRVQEVSAISRGLKILAKEIDCPVIALSQLSRAAEQRSDHRPQLSDLRESGSIEQDADMVCFLYREDYYQEKARSEIQGDQNEDEFGLAELIIAKHRNGPTGKINLAFFKRFTRFENYSEDMEF
jgi:replicative DNA helicase